MTLPAQAALVRGIDYHHVIGWLWVSRMLEDPGAISSVCVEDADGGAFDDVVVRRTMEPDLYIQARSSNYGKEIVDRTWLTKRKPKGKSALQHFFNTYRELAASGEEFSLELWTNKSFDPNNPLLGRLLDLNHGKIDTERMLDAGPRSAVGRERDSWAAHLEVTSDELVGFFNAVQWHHTDSELKLREYSKPHMRIAGLRYDAAAVRIGVSIVRGWVSDGLGPQGAADVVRNAEELGLLAERRDVPAAPESADGPVQRVSTAVPRLPPGCGARINSLLLVAPEDADRVASQLAQPTSRIPGVLDQFVDNPPQWLREADSLAWDAIVDFAAAHELPDSDRLRIAAIEEGSLRGPLYRVREAARAADDGDLELARELLEQVSDAYPLFGVVEARIEGDDRAVVGAVLGSRLHESEDPDLALFAVVMLVLAHSRMGETSQALTVLRDASRRFPERASLYLYRADLTLATATSLSDGGMEYSDLLRSAAKFALQARDRIREWDGPSGQAVATAATALILLNELERACALATGAPDGEATREEARHPDVVECLAEALLVLGRREQLDNVNIELLDPPAQAHLRALRAHSRGDPDALPLMREALEQATDDRLRLRAHHGLALFGELDETALAQISTADDAHKDLIRAMAHFHRDEYAASVDLLRRHRDSLIHTELLARVQHRSGATEDAIETLKTAAESRGAPSLYLDAVHLRVEQGRLREAEKLALAALNSDVSRNVERGLRLVLIDIASKLQAWAGMESSARALFTRFPEVPIAPWAVTQALVGQVRLQEAWDFLVKHELSPIDEQTAGLAIQVCFLADASNGAVECLLDIATRFSQSTEIAGAALAALMVKGGQITLTDAQRSLLVDMVDSYVERFPESEVLRAFQVETLDDLREAAESLTRSQAAQLAEIINHVRNGQAPYGLLATMRANPYAELLLSLAAGYLTAITLDDAKRESERRVARAAIAGDVAVDTSVVVVGIRSGLPVDRLASQFRQVLVADELVYDSRAAVVSASQTTAGYVGHFPAAGGVTVTEITEEQREHMQDDATRLVEIMHGWQSVPSARIESPFRFAEAPPGFDKDRLKPWDASLRVAAEREVALWCDDIALRSLAEDAGIPTFGSYALFEVLATEAGMEDFPPVNEIKAQLLRSGIADVPLTWDELSGIADADPRSDLAAIRFLDRPFRWARPPLALEWYTSQVELLASDPDHNRLLQLVRAACSGRGMAVDRANSEEVMGDVLATTLNTVRLSAVDPAERVPGIIEAGEYASREVDPSDSLNVLRPALTILHNRLVTQVGPTLASANLGTLFAQTTEAHRNMVAAVILGANS